MTATIRRAVFSSNGRPTQDGRAWIRSTGGQVWFVAFGGKIVDSYSTKKKAASKMRELNGTRRTTK